ncbi:MAG: hypothetical protein PARBA_01712 [Parabacteroides sp.]
MKTRTKLQNQSSFFKMVLALAASVYLLATCTVEADKADRAPTDGTDSGNKREVLLSFKNKLTVKATKSQTKADAPIATEAENEIATLDVYVFGAKTEGDTYTFRERFSYRQDGSALPAGAKKLNLAPGADNATTTALLELQKGLFVRLYCIANQTELIDPVDGNPVSDTYFDPLTYDIATGVLTDGTPTEEQFRKFYSPLLTNASPALGLPLPMTGAQTTPIDLTDFGSSARVQVGFKLTRTMARFDISNIEADSKFHLESISMGNGRRGTTFFPVKAYGAIPAADGELITYPTRIFEGEKANEGLQVSAFYSYPGPLEDKGYLILNGTYQVNQTEAKEVTYQIPFKQQTADGSSVALEVNANHRYTIGITKADIYKLDFTLQVDDWNEGDNLDDYNPNVNGAGELTVTIPDPFKGETLYNKELRTVSMSLKAGSKFYVETQSIATLTLQKKYVGGFAAQQYDWLEISDPETSLVPETGQTNYKYTVTLKDSYDKPRFPRAVVRLTNIIDASERVLFIEALATPQVVEVRQDAGNHNTFDLDLLTASLYRVTGSKVKVNVSCPDGSTVASLPDWLEAKVLETKIPVTTYELSLKDGSRDVEVAGDEGEVVFQNAKNNTLNTAITVKLLDASITANFDALGGTGNTYDAPHDGVFGNINMPLSSGNNFTVSTTSLDGVKIKMDFGTGPEWLAHNGSAASARAGDVPNTLRFSLITDKAGEGKAQPVTVTLQNLSGGIDHQFTVTPGYQAPSLTTPASVTLHAAADNNIPSITITGTCPGGTTLEGPAWLTYPETSAATDNFSYTVQLDPSQTDFPTSVPADQLIKLVNKTDPDKSTTVTVRFTEANARLATDLSGYDESNSNGYRVVTGGKTITVSFYSMFAPTLSTSYDGSYCNSQNGGNSWLNNSKLVKTEVVNNRCKYTFNVVVNAASGTDAAYQLHRAVMNIRHNGNTIKSYTIWRGASYYGYPAGGDSPYYTAIRKNGKWWAPVNCGASRVAQAGDGKNGTVAGTGNIYQWGRYEATNHGGPTANGPTGSTRPGNNTFYKAPNDPYNWLNRTDNSLWNGSSKGANDPCPSGYRVPTDSELMSIGNATSYDDSGFKVNAESGCPQLILPAAGYRGSSYGSSNFQGSYGYYWSSSVPSGNTYARYVYFNSATFYQDTLRRAYGFSVRCLRQ